MAVIDNTSYCSLNAVYENSVSWRNNSDNISYYASKRGKYDRLVKSPVLLMA
jgi:hypothetical protein